MSRPYAGDLSPLEAWKVLKEDPDAVLVDVRTMPEWSLVGLPDLQAIGKQAVTASWQVYPSMQTNPRFVDEVRAAGARESAPVLLLCRSGARSAAAAMALTQVGYTKAFNIEDGFEGPHNETRQRGRVAGWKVAGLPWVQG